MTHRTQWLLGALVAGYALVAAAVIVVLLIVAGAGSERIVVAAIAGVLALAGLVALVARLVGARVTAVRRLTTDVRLLLDANPDHEIDRTGHAKFGELAALSAAVDALARRRRDAEQEVDAQVDAARADVEAERNRLATLMAELRAAVLVCNDEGRILLYNAAAKGLLGEDAPVGLGRSVFGIVDRELIVHALDRIGEVAESPTSHVSTTLRGDRLLQVQVARARGADGTAVGYVLLLEDLTERVAASVRVDDSLRQVTEGTRASLASIQAAIENVLEFPDMDAGERQQFLGIVREESVSLGRRVQEWVDESANHLGRAWPRTHMSVEDLLVVAAKAIERDIGVPATAVGGVGWVRVDGHAISRALVALAGRIHSAAFDLAAVPAGGHVRIELRWAGAGPAPGEFASWLAEPLPGGTSLSAGDILARHGGEAWCEAGEPNARMCLLLPVTEPVAAKPPPPQIPSRPEFYDFGLFERHAGAGDSSRDLVELSYTVFDTETTGLDPTRGDRIVSVGAVRVVNVRVLHSETFERLVDPQRAVPAVSTAVHGITTAMVRGQPTIAEVLPAFDRFTADTVLVGHNVGFDLQFLRFERERAGMSTTSPVVLDTLLLDAVLHPEHEEHSLEAIAGRLGVDVLGRHTALGDALVTGEVFVRLVALLKGTGIHTLDEAVAASRTTLQARLDESMYGSRR